MDTPAQPSSHTSETDYRTQEKLRESEQKFRAVVDAALDAIIMTDETDRIVLWNKAAETLFGYPQEEIIGKELHSLIPVLAEHKTKKERLVHFQKTGESDVLGKTLELPVATKAGKTVDIELTIGRVQLHNAWYAIGIIRDITKRKEIEHALKGKMAELERMNALMVGRELKMIEMKKEIDELRKKDSV